MMPWDFIIESPEDLPIFADLLEEWCHPGTEVARYLVKHNKFPFLWNIKQHLLYSEWSFGRHNKGSPTWLLPKKMKTGELEHHYIRYNTITEAIWAVINAKVYKPKRKKKQS